MAAAVGRVLVVDDERDNRFVIGKLMENRLHCDVVLAASVDEALEQISSSSFDVIVSDYEMPRRNGMDLASELSARHCETPFLIYSAYNISKWELQKFDLVADVVQKPNIEDLFSIISELMGWPLDPPGYRRGTNSELQ
jgi:CheY-like chemotaxis protein